MTMTPKKIVMITLFMLGLIAGAISMINPSLIGLVEGEFPTALFLYMYPTCFLFWVGIHAGYKTAEGYPWYCVLIGCIIGLYLSPIIALYQIFFKN